MTPADIADLRALCEAASPAPWGFFVTEGRLIGFPLTDEGIAAKPAATRADENFASAACTALPAALDEIERLRALIRRATSEVEAAHSRGISAAVLAEREACAKACDEQSQCPADRSDSCDGAIACAATIRARSTP